MPTKRAPSKTPPSGSGDKRSKGAINAADADGEWEPSIRPPPGQWADLRDYMPSRMPLAPPLPSPPSPEHLSDVAAAIDVSTDVEPDEVSTAAVAGSQVADVNTMELLFEGEGLGDASLTHGADTEKGTDVEEKAEETHGAEAEEKAPEENAPAAGPPFSGARTAAMFGPPLMMGTQLTPSLDELDVDARCRICTSVVDPLVSGVRFFTKSKQWQCPRCGTRMSGIAKICGTTQLPELDAMDETERFTFIASLPNDLRSMRLKIAELIIRKRIHSKADEVSGESLPLSVWSARGFDITDIEQNTDPADIEKHPVLGLCYRVKLRKHLERIEEAQLRQEVLSGMTGLGGGRLGGRPSPSAAAPPAPVESKVIEAPPRAEQEDSKSSSDDSSSSSSDKKKKKKKNKKKLKKMGKADKKSAALEAELAKLRAQLAAQQGAPPAPHGGLTAAQEAKAAEKEAKKEARKQVAATEKEARKQQAEIQKVTRATHLKCSKAVMALSGVVNDFHELSEKAADDIPKVLREPFAAAKMQLMAWFTEADSKMKERTPSELTFDITNPNFTQSLTAAKVAAVVAARYVLIILLSLLFPCLCLFQFSVLKGFSLYVLSFLCSFLV